MSDGKIKQFRNCRILWKHQIIREDLWVRNGKILNPEKVFFDERVQADIVVDCQNNIISPGYIELQINGAFGEDFSNASSSPDDIKKAVKKIARGVLAHGVTSMCPTIVTSPSENYSKIIPHIPRCNGSKEGAGVLGLHLEGPFINKEKKGAHPENLIRGFDNGFQDLEEYYGDLSSTSIVTIAPELKASDEVITKLCERNITVSLGHSMANLSEGEKAVKSGASFITHLFNAMLPFHHRDPHLVGLLASNKIPDNTTVFYGMISDGIHTHPAALRIAHRTHPKGLVLVTDAVPSMGLPDGVYDLGVQRVEVKGKRAVIAGTDILCGSIATLSECVQYFMNQTGCTQVEALECATLHPAQTLGITNQKGTLDYNSDADLVILDDQLNVLETYIAGELVWKKST